MPPRSIPGCRASRPVERLLCGIVYAMLVLLVAPCPRGSAEEPPVVPVGLDAYRQRERWPYQRIGTRASMRGTYDRGGGNQGGADASHFLYQTADDFNVTLDVEGPGVLYFARSNHWHGRPPSSLPTAIDFQ